MPQGDKSSYSAKQKRKAEHIEEGYEKRGVRSKEAARRAWATVNKQDGGARRKRTKAKTSSSSRGRKSTTRTTRTRTAKSRSTSRSRSPARSRAASRSRR